MTATAKIFYKPVGLGLSLAAGAGLEAAVFAAAKASATRLQAEGIRHAVEADKSRRNHI
jgi:hypothetical protein